MSDLSKPTAPALSIRPLADYAGILRPGTRILGMDVGSKTIGLALSAPDWSMILPMSTVKRTAKWHMDLAALEKTLKGFDIGAVVIGWPLNMDDSEGPSAQRMRSFAMQLQEAAPKWLQAPKIITLFDERLSTSASLDQLQHHSMKFAKRSGALDAMAAQDILQRALFFLGQHDV